METINSLPTGKFCILFEKIKNTTNISNSLNPDQAGHFVGPDLGPNHLQRLSADNLRR